MKQSASNDIITIRPHLAQFVINELPWLVLCAAGYIYAGMGGLPIGKVILTLAFALTLCLAYRLLYMRRTIFTLGEEQLTYEHGIMQRGVDYLEFYRVIDFYEHQTFIQQLCGLKTVTIYSQDKSTPKLDIIGVPKNRDIVSVIRCRVEVNKRRMHIHEITNR